MGNRFSWLGGRDDKKADAASVRRAHKHRRNATKTDRRGWRDHEQRDRKIYGD